MTPSDYTLETKLDHRTLTMEFRWRPKIGRPFTVKVSQHETLERQKRSFSKQLYVHALRLAEKEFDDGAAPNEVAARADEILVELSGMLNK